MDPFTVSVVVDRPREQVFDYLQDIANHPEFTDHYLVDWHLTRIDSVGRGAGASFRAKVPGPGARFAWGDVTFVEVQPPHRIVEVGRAGKANRIRTVGVYELVPGPGGTTRVQFTLETEPVNALRPPAREPRGRAPGCAVRTHARCAGCAPSWSRARAAASA